MFYFRLLVTTKERMGSMNMDVVSIQQELGTKVHTGKVTSGGLYKNLKCPAGLTDLEWKKYQQTVHFTILMTFLLNFFYLCNLY